MPVSENKKEHGTGRQRGRREAERARGERSERIEN